MTEIPDSRPVALITGGADRLGAEIARTLHASGLSVMIHYRSSETKAQALARDLNEQAPGTADTVSADMLDWEAPRSLIDAVASSFGRLDVLVNNASTFYPTPLGTVTEAQWRDLMGVNLRAPFFLAQAAAPLLRVRKGSIVNLVDIHGIRPKKDHPVYSMAKAANAMMVKTLARELGPEIRVNGVAPGAILWPEHETLTEDKKREILSRTTLHRAGTAADIARTVRFLALEADYISGQIIAVDGGRMTQQ